MNFEKTDTLINVSKYDSYLLTTEIVQILFAFHENEIAASKPHFAGESGSVLGFVSGS